MPSFHWDVEPKAGEALSPPVAVPPTATMIWVPSGLKAMPILSTEVWANGIEKMMEEMVVQRRTCWVNHHKSSSFKREIHVSLGFFLQELSMIVYVKNGPLEKNFGRSVCNHHQPSRCRGAPDAVAPFFPFWHLEDKIFGVMEFELLTSCTSWKRLMQVVVRLPKNFWWKATGDTYRWYGQQKYSPVFVPWVHCWLSGPIQVAKIPSSLWKRLS